MMRLLRRPRYGDHYSDRLLALRAALDIDEAQKLRARAGIRAKGAQHFARDHRDAAFVNAARRHALMHCVDHDPDAARLENIVDARGNLRGELLLHLKPARVTVDDSRELADADDAIGGQVTDMGVADNGRHVMLAKRFETDVAEHHHFIVTLDFFEGAP